MNHLIFVVFKKLQNLLSTRRVRFRKVVTLVQTHNFLPIHQTELAALFDTSIRTQIFFGEPLGVVAAIYSGSTKIALNFIGRCYFFFVCVCVCVCLRFFVGEYYLECWEQRVSESTRPH